MWAVIGATVGTICYVVGCCWGIAVMVGDLSIIYDHWYTEVLWTFWYVFLWPVALPIYYGKTRCCRLADPPLRIVTPHYLAVHDFDCSQLPICSPPPAYNPMGRLPIENEVIGP